MIFFDGFKLAKSKSFLTCNLEISFASYFIWTISQKEQFSSEAKKNTTNLEIFFRILFCHTSSCSNNPNNLTILSDHLRMQKLTNFDMPSVRNPFCYQQLVASSNNLTVKRSSPNKRASLNPTLLIMKQGQFDPLP